MPDREPEKRICGYRHCDVDISDKRPQAIYCGPAHKAAADRERSGGWIRDRWGNSDGDAKTYRTSSGRPRRKVRDGVGTRIYVLREELDAVLDLLDGDTRDRDDHLRRFEQKVRAAADRLTRSGA